MKNELLLEQQPNSITNAELLPSASLAQNTLLCDVFKGKLAILKEDFLPESEHWKTGYWHLKKGQQVYIRGNESDGTCYIEYIGAVFEIDYGQLNIS